jgi:hypothetical protein
MAFFDIGGGQTKVGVIALEELARQRAEARMAEEMAFKQSATASSMTQDRRESDFRMQQANAKMQQDTRDRAAEMLRYEQDRADRLKDKEFGRGMSLNEMAYARERDKLKDKNSEREFDYRGQRDQVGDKTTLTQMAQQRVRDRMYGEDRDLDREEKKRKALADDETRRLQITDKDKAAKLKAFANELDFETLEYNVRDAKTLGDMEYLARAERDLLQAKQKLRQKEGELDGVSVQGGQGGVHVAGLPMGPEAKGAANLMAMPEVLNRFKNRPPMTMEKDRPPLTANELGAIARRRVQDRVEQEKATKKAEKALAEVEKKRQLKTAVMGKQFPNLAQLKNVMKSFDMTPEEEADTINAHPTMTELRRQDSMVADADNPLEARDYLELKLSVLDNATFPANNPFAQREIAAIQDAITKAGTKDSPLAIWRTRKRDEVKQMETEGVDVAALREELSARKRKADAAAKKFIEESNASLNARETPAIRMPTLRGQEAQLQKGQDLQKLNELMERDRKSQYINAFNTVGGNVNDPAIEAGLRSTIEQNLREKYGAYYRPPVTQ